MVNETYSHQSFQNVDLSGEDVADFNNTEIVGSSFFQENAPNSHIFPPGMTGVVFRSCNLDNVFVPPTCSMVDCTNKSIRVQNDLSDWVVDGNGSPTEPMDRDLREAAGISIDPATIPQARAAVDVFEKRRRGEI